MTHSVNEESRFRSPLRRLHDTLRWAGLVVRAVWPAYVLGSVLILTGISWALPDNRYQTQTFQADEGAAVHAVAQMHAPSFYPPQMCWGTALFYQVYAVKTLARLSHLFRVDDLAVYWIGRVLGYVSALGAITALFLLARRVFDTSTARLAAIFLAVSPGLVINSHYFKMDVPMTFWALLSLLAADQVLTSKAIRWLLVLGLLIGYCAATKYSGAALVPAGLTAVLLAGRELRRLAPVLSYFGCVLLGFLAGEPYALLKFSKLRHDLAFVVDNDRAGVPYVLGRPPGWLDYPVHVFPYALTWPLLLTGALGLGLGLARGRKYTRLAPALVFSAVSYAALSIDRFRFVRYTVPLLPLLALFAACFWTRVAALPRARLLAIIGSLAVAGYAFVFSLSYVHAMSGTDPRIQASRWIELHLPRDQPVPVSTVYYLDVPQLNLIGYEKREVGFSVARLASSSSRYLIVSDFVTRPFQEAIQYYPEQKIFFEYLAQRYATVATFENSQRLLGVNSKQGRHLPFDWLNPNPKITILRRQ